MGASQGELVILQVAAAIAGIFLLAGLWTPNRAEGGGGPLGFKSSKRAHDD
jgi:hypothetical protein